MLFLLDEYLEGAAFPFIRNPTSASGLQMSMRQKQLTTKPTIVNNIYVLLFKH